MRHTTNIKFHNFIPFVTIIIYTKGKKIWNKIITFIVVLEGVRRRRHL